MATDVVISAVMLSLLCAAAAIVMSLPLAIWLAHVLARRNFAGKMLVETLVMLPMVVPPVVTGYLLLVLLGRRGLLGPVLRLLDIHVAFTWFGAAIAQAVVALPLLVLPLRVAFESVDRDLEHAAATLGASRWRVFRQVTLPLSWHGLAAGSVLAFARALGEFGATIVIAGNIEGKTRTLPIAIFTALNQPGGESTAAGLVLIAIALACGSLVISRWLSDWAKLSLNGHSPRRPSGGA